MSSTLEALTRQLTNLANNRFNRQQTDKSGRLKTDKTDMRPSWHVFRMERVSLAAWRSDDDERFPRCNDRKQKNLKIIIMKVKPLADRVLIAPAPAEEKVGGIIIPDTAKEKPLRGKVIAVGNGTKDEEMTLKEGDEVLYGKYSGTELEFDGETYLIMRQSDVLAVVK